MCISDFRDAGWEKNISQTHKDINKKRKKTKEKNIPYSTIQRVITRLEKKGLLITKNWDLYNLSEMVFYHPTLDNSNIEQFYHKAHKRYFLRPKIIIRRLLKIRSWTQFMQEIKGGLALLGI